MLFLGHQISLVYSNNVSSLVYGGGCCIGKGECSAIAPEGSPGPLKELSTSLGHYRAIYITNFRSRDNPVKVRVMRPFGCNYQ